MVECPRYCIIYIRLKSPLVLYEFLIFYCALLFSFITLSLSSSFYVTCAPSGGGVKFPLPQSLTF